MKCEKCGTEVVVMKNLERQELGGPEHTELCCLKSQLASMTKRAEEAEAIARVASAQRDDIEERAGSGNGESCAHCGKPCSSFAGNPGEWPLLFGNGEKRSWIHVACVWSLRDIARATLRALGIDPSKDKS